MSRFRSSRTGVGLPVDPPFNNIPANTIPPNITSNNYTSQPNEFSAVFKFPQDFTVGVQGFRSVRMLNSGNCFRVCISSITHPRQAAGFTQVYSNPPLSLHIARNQTFGPSQMFREQFLGLCDHHISNNVAQLVDPNVSLYGYVQGSIECRGLEVTGYTYNSLDISPVVPPGLLGSFSPAGTTDPTWFYMGVYGWTDTSRPYSFTTL